MTKHRESAADGASGAAASTRAWRISGRVQGVGFRYSTRERMAALGLGGSATNCSDGSVHVEAAGAPDALDALERWLWHGPQYARVGAVERCG